MEDALKTVEIAQIPDRQGQKLRNFLVDHMHGSGTAGSRWRLTVSLTATTASQGIRKDDTATRAQLRMIAAYQLTDNTTGVIVDSGTSRSLVNYNILESQYGTLVNDRDAEDRALRDVGQDIVNRLALYFSGKSSGQKITM